MRLASWALVSACALLAACTTTGPDVRADPAAARQEINAEANATRSRLYQAASGARDLVARADAC